MKFRSFSQGLFCICLMLAAVFASTPDATAQETVSVMISAIILDEGRTTGLWTGDGRSESHGAATLFLRSGEVSRELSVPFGTLSAPFHYSGPPVLRFFRRPLSPDPEDPLPEVTASVRLPSNASDVLLIFVTDDFDSQSFRIVPLDISPRAAPNNSIRIINFTGVPVAWNFAGKSGELTPGSMTLARVDEKSGLHRLQFASFCPDVNDWRVRYNRRLRIIPDRRFEMILIPRPGDSSNFAVTVIRDFVSYRQRLSAQDDRELPIHEAPPDVPVSVRAPRVDQDLPDSGEIEDE